MPKVKAVPQFTKGDFRRMLVIAAAIDQLPRASLVEIAADTGLDKRTISHTIEQLQRQAYLTIHKDGPVYHLADWGPIIKRTGALAVYSGKLCVDETDKNKHKGALNTP